MEKDKFVLGFAFDEHYNNVLLIEKNRPVWQKGKLNGIGGKIEKNETAIQAMAREFKEETSIDSNYNDWVMYCDIHFYDGDMNVYYTNNINIKNYKNVTDEKLSIVSVDEIMLGNRTTMNNLPWLILMALQKDFNYLSISYNSNNG